MAYYSEQGYFVMITAQSMLSVVEIEDKKDEEKKKKKNRKKGMSKGNVYNILQHSVFIKCFHCFVQCSIVFKIRMLPICLIFYVNKRITGVMFT